MYGNSGRVDVTIDALGNRTSYTCDAKGRLTQDSTTGTGAQTYDYTYDGNDNRLTSSEIGLVSTFTYNAFGQVTTRTDGNLTVVAEDGFDRVTMSYDDDNRMKRINHSDATITAATGGVRRSVFRFAPDSCLKRTSITGGFL